MRRAVIVSTARTPIGRAYRGVFNDTQPQALAGHAIAEAVRRAGVDPAEIDDVICGSVGGAQINIGRSGALLAGVACPPAQELSARAKVMARVPGVTRRIGLPPCVAAVMVCGRSSASATLCVRPG